VQPGAARIEEQAEGEGRVSTCIEEAVSWLQVGRVEEPGRNVKERLFTFTERGSSCDAAPRIQLSTSHDHGTIPQLGDTALSVSTIMLDD